MPKKSSGPGGSDFGMALTVLRTIRGLTQEELGRRSRVRSASISEYESGKVDPELRTLRQLLEAMDLPLSALEEAKRFAERIRSRSLSELSQEREDAENVSLEVGRVATLFARTVFALARGCGGSGVTAPPAEALSLPSQEEESRVPELWQKLRGISPAVRLAQVERDVAFRNSALVRFLCKESITAAGSDPKRAVSLGELAVSIARQIEAPAPFKARLLGYALCHLANAENAAGSLPAADRIFDDSETLWTPWRPDTPDSLDDATVYALKASLRRAQGRFAEALALNDQALASRGAEAIRCQLLISKGYTLDESGDLAGAVSAFQDAASSLTGTEEPRVLLALRHNLADALSKAGQFAEAKQLIGEIKRLAGRAGGDLDFARVQWVEGRVEAGLGNVDAALSLLQQVRGVFMSKGIALDAALVTLELAFLYVGQGRMTLVKDLARNLASLFKAQALPRETLAALQLFRRAAEGEAVTAELVERLVGYLRRSRYIPDMRFEA
jgi:transcriptional regulator with XRE-family HTH domain